MAARVRSIVQSSTEVALATASVAAATLAFGPFYFGSGWLLPVLGAVVVGAAIPLVPGLRRRPVALLVPVGLLALALYVMWTLRTGETLYGLPTPDALRATGDDLVSGWARALTVALPADADPGLLAFPVTVGFAAAFTAVAMTVRTRTVIGLGAPAVAVLLVALAVTAGRGTPLTGVTVAVLLVLLLLVLVRANRSAAERTAVTAADAEAVGIDLAAERRHSTLGRVLLGLPGALAVAALATGGALTLPLADGSARADPRVVYRPEVRQEPGLSPLVEVKPQLVATEPELYRVDVSAGDAEVDRIRIAALEEFDGALWSQGGTFVLAGTRLPVPDPITAPADRVTLAVEVLTGRTPFLPVVGTPTAVRGVEAAVEPLSGTLMLLPDGDADERADAAPRYEVTAEVARTDDLPLAGVPELAPARLTALPDRPGWVAEAAGQAAAGRTPHEDLVGIQDYLRQLQYDSGGRPGHSYGALRRLLQADSPEPGYAEQYAAAFAVLAREKGYAARVAVGYLLDDTSRAGDTYVVLPKHVHAWPEVYFVGYGWMAFEPTPFENAVVSQPDRRNPPPIESVDLGPVREAQEDPDAEDERGEVGGSTLAAVARTSALVVAGLVGATLLLLAGIALGKVVRRARRRTTGPPARRVAAAWREATDRLRELGYPVAESLTPLETVRAAAEGPATAARDELTELALIATTAVCAPADPTAAAARRAWEVEAAVRARLDARVPPARRIGAWLDPRPLLPRSGPARSGPARSGRPARPDRAGHRPVVRVPDAAEATDAADPRSSGSSR